MKVNHWVRWNCNILTVNIRKFSHVCNIFRSATLLFEMFVIAIARDEFEAIFSDETLVEQAKKQVKENQNIDSQKY